MNESIQNKQVLLKETQRKSILMLSHTEAREFLLKAESYCRLVCKLLFKNVNSYGANNQQLLWTLEPLISCRPNTTTFTLCILKSTSA